MQPPKRTVSKVVYIDIDDTLVRSFGSKRIPMADMVALVPKLRDHGAELYCRSSGGAAYARTSAEELGIADCFVAYLPKPQLLIDDISIAKWKLLELHPNQCRSVSVSDLLDRSRG